MSESHDDLQALWKAGDPSPVDPDLYRTVIKQTRWWYIVLAIEIFAILIGITVPLATVIRNPEPFWIAWAVDLWGVVAISGWFVLTRAKNLLTEPDQTTDAYARFLRQRYEHQIKVSRIGAVLASLQFVILPLLALWQIDSMRIELSSVIGVYAGVLLVMAGYIGVMARVARNARRKIKYLPTGSSFE